MSRAQRDAQLGERWTLVSSRTAQAAAALAELAAARQAPPTLSHVTQLLDAIEHPECRREIWSPALNLLSRWARQQGLRPAAARAPAPLLQRTVTAACRLLAAAVEPGQAAGCILLLGSVAAAIHDSSTGDDIAEAVGSALLSGLLGTPEPGTAADAAAAVGGILPCLMAKPEAAGWLLGALLQWLGSCTLGSSPAVSHTALDCLAPCYAMMRGTATAALARTQPALAVAGLLHPAYCVLKTAAAAVAGAPQAPAARPVSGSAYPASVGEAAAVVAGAAGAAHAAAAVLGIAGLAEGLLRSAAGYADATQLAADAEAPLVAACESAVGEAALEAAAWPDAPAPTAAGLAAAPQKTAQTAAAARLLQDACSLATAQLAAAARRPRLATSVARCQAHSLLHSALSLGPLCQAAAEQQEPAEAARQLRRVARGALAEQAGSLARSVAEQYPSLDADSQAWVLRQVQAAALQAHKQYQRYSLATPAAWLAAMDAAVVRQLLDRLFLSCLVLLAAAWQAAPPHVARSQRAQLATAVLVPLADLQFCRVATPQYASLLTAVLGEVPGEASAAATLAASLPCYAELAACCPARGNQPAWLVDGVAAAKVQLLMLALVPCCGTLPQAALQERLAPLAFLYLLHPHRALGAAAHQLFCALLVAVAPEQRREPLAAYYVRRSLEGCPGATLELLSEFGQGLATVLQALPVGSPVALMCLQQVLEKWQELAARADPAAPQLAPLAAQQLLLVDHALLGEAMPAFDRVMCQMSPAGEPAGSTSAAAGAGAAAEPPQSSGATRQGAEEAAGTMAGPRPSSAAAALERELLAAVRGTDDYLRKPALARWLLARQGGRPAASGLWSLT